MLEYSCGCVYPRPGPLCFTGRRCPECRNKPARQLSAANARRAKRLIAQAGETAEWRQKCGAEVARVKSLESQIHLANEANLSYQLQIRNERSCHETTESQLDTLGKAATGVGEALQEWYSMEASKWIAKYGLTGFTWGSQMKQLSARLLAAMPKKEGA